MAYGFPSTTLAKIEQVFKDDGLVNNEILTTRTSNSYLVQYSSNNAPLCAFSFGDRGYIPEATLERLRLVLVDDGIISPATTTGVSPFYFIYYKANNSFAYSVSSGLELGNYDLSPRAIKQLKEFDCDTYLDATSVLNVWKDEYNKQKISDNGSYILETHEYNSTY